MGGAGRRQQACITGLTGFVIPEGLKPILESGPILVEVVSYVPLQERVDAT